MNISTKFESNLTAKLEGLATAASFKVRTDALMQGAEPIRAAAERNAPRRTGKLASHIIAEPYTASEIERGSDWKGDEAAVAIGPDADHFYGYFREFGTVKEAARPWFRPAWDSRVGVAMNLVLGALWTSVRNAAGGSSSTGIGGGNIGNVGSRNL